MNLLLGRMAPFLHLTRITTAFAAVSNVWFVILWTRAVEEERAFAPAGLRNDPLWLLLAGGAAYAAGLFAFATALNDTLDLRRDRLLHPARPLASGRMSVEAAAGLVAATLLLAMLGAAILGTPAVLMALLTTGTVLAYHFAARYFPSVGLVTLGLIYGAHMMTANAYLIFVWPVLFVMAHALLLGAAAHILGRRRPRLTPARLAWSVMGWAFWSGVLLYVGVLRAGSLWPEWVPWHAAAAPAALAVGFLIFAWGKARRAADPLAAAEKIRRYGAFWATLYGIAWMATMGHAAEAGILAGLTAAGWLGMTVLREVYSLIEHPVGYRR